MIIWPTIDLSSKSTQQGILSLAAGGFTALGGALLPLLTAHPSWTWLPVASFACTALTGAAKWAISLYQGDAAVPRPPKATEAFQFPNKQ